MNTSKTTSTPLHNVVRWIARISSIPVILVFLLMFFGEGFDPAKVKPRERLMLLFGPFGLMLGMILGWWKESLGGAIVILSFLGAMLVGDYNASGAAYMAICPRLVSSFSLPGFFPTRHWLVVKKGITDENHG